MWVLATFCLVLLGWGKPVIRGDRAAWTTVSPLALAPYMVAWGRGGVRGRLDRGLDRGARHYTGG